MQYSTSDTFDGRPCLALSLSFSLAHRNNAAVNCNLFFPRHAALVWFVCWLAHCLACLAHLQSSAGAFELLVSSAKPFDAFASFVLAPPDRRLPRVKLGSVASSKQRRERPRLQSLIGDKNKCVPVEIVSSGALRARAPLTVARAHRCAGLFSQSLSRAVRLRRLVWRFYFLAKLTHARAQRSKSTITKKRARAGAAKTSPTTTTVPAAAATAVAGVVPGLPGARKPRTKSSLVFFDRCSKVTPRGRVCAHTARWRLVCDAATNCTRAQHFLRPDVCAVLHVQRRRTSARV